MKSAFLFLAVRVGKNREAREATKCKTQGDNRARGARDSPSVYANIPHLTRSHARYLRGALHNLTGRASHKLEARVGARGAGSCNFIAAGYISEPNRDEMFKIVVQPIAFKAKHLSLSLTLSLSPVLDTSRSIPYRVSPFASRRSGHDLFPSFSSDEGEREILISRRAFLVRRISFRESENSQRDIKKKKERERRD